MSDELKKDELEQPQKPVPSRKAKPVEPKKSAAVASADAGTGLDKQYLKEDRKEAEKERAEATKEANRRNESMPPGVGTGTTGAVKEEDKLAKNVTAEPTEAAKRDKEEKIEGDKIARSLPPMTGNAEAPKTNKRGVKEQYNPGGDRFTSQEASFKSTEAPRDIYPSTGIYATPPQGDVAPADPDILDRPPTQRDAEALVRSAISQADILSAVRVLAKNPISTPEGAVDVDGKLLNPPEEPVHPNGVEAEERIAREGLDVERDSHHDEVK